MALQIQAVLQAQDAELVLAQFVVETTADLIGVLCDAFLDDLMIILVVTIHLSLPILENQFSGDAGQRGCQQASQEFFRYGSCGK